jgi:L-amino acid N-acyltransferase YncA
VVAPTIRQADPHRDAAACAAIYAPFVNDSAVSFEEMAPSGEEMGRRIEQTSALYPWLVAERGDEVAGFAYGAAHRSRAAYRWAADVSAYIGERHRGQGLGTELYRVLLELLRGQGIQVAAAGITLPNPASVALHESLGFEPVGVWRRVGWKDGAWRDVGWWQLDLIPVADAPPAEVSPPIAPGPT